MSSKDIEMLHVCTKGRLCFPTEPSYNTSQSPLNTLLSDDVHDNLSPGTPEGSESEDDQQVAHSETGHQRRVQNAQFEAL